MTEKTGISPDGVFRILVVEDDATLLSVVGRGLLEQGYTTECVSRLRGARAKLRGFSPDFVLLDLGLPDGDGVDLLTDLRALPQSPFVLITTARDSVEDRVRGLDAGADDYLVKPYSFPELLARLRAFRRRRAPLIDSVELAVREVRLHLTERKAWCGGTELVLTPREFDLLACFLRRPGEVVTREVLAADVWKSPQRFTPIDNLIDVNVSRLRNKLVDAGCSMALATLRGIGYRLGVET